MLRPIFVHCRPSAGYDQRFDSLMMVNGSVAVLNSIARSLLGYPGIAVDETYMGKAAEGNESYLLQYLRETIVSYLAVGDEPVVFCTLLTYNAERSIRLLEELKREFGRHLRTGVGGQLVRCCPMAYKQNRAIDHIGIGDAEMVLKRLLIGKQRMSNLLGAPSYKPVSPEDHYAVPLYDNYLGLPERLDEMSMYKLGKFSGIRQLITESVRGCAWAHATKKACEFCSLQGVGHRPVFRNITDHFRIERELAEKYDLNWIFDVSNQWLPTIHPQEMVDWLREYAAKRRELDHHINRYVYLTSNSITKETAPLLSEAGIRMAYVGVDGWDEDTRYAHHKAQANIPALLERCRDNDIYVRTGLVIGSGLTPDNLDELPKFAERLVSEYDDVIIHISTFLEIVLPGSETWSKFERLAEEKNIPEAKELFRFFFTNGYLSLDQEDRLNELRIQHTQTEVTLDQVKGAWQAAQDAIKGSEKVLSTTLRESEKLSRTDE